ncbi:Zinc finger CCHC-type [Arabidopsis suecica]|uniref:Zinc finger CCHC-type n=1 Tax=Arabidopsis suecica TaxID=45249 RepID=A0A8T2DGY6_ARASU|nr:Zinc finger CCHC-type [Arabidopsis suecica]
MREAPEVNVPPRGIPEVVAPLQDPPPPLLHPMQAHVQETTYLDALRYLKDASMEFFSGKSDPIVADNWRKKLERNLDNVRCPQAFRKELAVQYLKDEAQRGNLPDGARVFKALSRKHDWLSRFSSRALDEEELVRMFIRGCSKCGDLEHSRENCPRGLDHCHWCGRRGHHARDCKRQQVDRNEEQLPPPPKRPALGRGD